MNRWAFSWTVALAVSACSSTKIVERSAVPRPDWVEQTPESRDQLYFVGTCTDLPSYQEALRCARSEALAEVGAWVGARLSASAYSASSESARSSGALVYYDSEIFLADARRSDTYHEVRQADWGLSYRVSVLLTYPVSAAERERARMEATTDRADRLVEEAPAKVRGLADEGRWGDAMKRILDIAADVAVPHNLNRSRHIDRLAGLSEELSAPLRLSGTTSGTQVDIQAMFRERPAAGVPLECTNAGVSAGVVTSGDGRATCDIEQRAPEEVRRVMVRPDIKGYIAAVPQEAAALAAALVSLLDRSIVLEDEAPPVHIAVSLHGEPGCETAVSELRSRLSAAGVQFTADAGPRLSVACRVTARAMTGNLHSAAASGILTLDGVGSDVESSARQVHGLGPTPEAAEEEALRRLGGELSDSALQLLSSLAVG